MRMKHLLSLWMSLMAAGVSAQTFTVLHTFGAGADGVLPENVVCVGNTLYGTTYEGGTNDSGTVFAVNTDGTDYTVLHSFGALAVDIEGEPSTNADGSSPEGPLIAARQYTLRHSAVWRHEWLGHDLHDHHQRHQFFGPLYFSRIHRQAGHERDGKQSGGGPAFVGRHALWPEQQRRTNRVGTLFSINTNGNNYTVVFNFAKTSSGTNAYGSNPANTLIQAGDTLYAPAGFGGPDGVGHGIFL